MSSLTANRGYTKAAGTEQYDVDIVNANLDAVDGDIDTLFKRLNSSNGFGQFAFTAGLTGNIAHGLGRVPKAIFITQWAGASWNGVIFAVSQTAGHLDGTNFRVRAKDLSNADFVGNAGFMWIAI